MRRERRIDPMRILVVLGLLSMVAGGCAGRSAVTTWGYSHWYREGGGGMGSFESQRRRCLEEAGITKDPASVAPDSAVEDAFIACMNGAGWCTSDFNCSKPGA
jgi:hypothetical protein